MPPSADTTGLGPARRSLAIEIALREGSVSSRRLAEECHIKSVNARTILSLLVDDGMLMLHRRRGFVPTQIARDTSYVTLPEAVNHPSHYGGVDNPYEAIKVIEAWQLDFCLGNAVKYISRAGKKDPAKTVEDLKKAAWYLNRAIERMAR